MKSNDHLSQRHPLDLFLEMLKSFMFSKLCTSQRMQYTSMLKQTVRTANAVIYRLWPCGKYLQQLL
jgi:hypothetical protein